MCWVDPPPPPRKGLEGMPPRSTVKLKRLAAKVLSTSQNQSGSPAEGTKGVGGWSIQCHTMQQSSIQYNQWLPRMLCGHPFEEYQSNRQPAMGEGWVGGPYSRILTKWKSYYTDSWYILPTKIRICQNFLSILFPTSTPSSLHSSPLLWFNSTTTRIVKTSFRISIALPSSLTFLLFFTIILQ